MIPAQQVFALRDLLMESCEHLRVVGDGADDIRVELAGVCLIGSADQLGRARQSAKSDEERPVLWIVSPDAAGYAALAESAVKTLPSGPVVVWPTPELTPAAIGKAAWGRLVLLADPALSPESIIALAGRAMSARQGTVARRLTSLQRSLTQALAAEKPIVDLVNRVARTCNAAVALVDPRGFTQHSTAPLPLTRFLHELNRAPDHERLFSMDGWNAVAVPVAHDGLEPDRHGWLIAASRRDTFPDPHSVAAVHIAASLAETSHQVERMARKQEDAIASALLEQVLAMKLERHDAELSGRVAALGISFESEVRAFLVRLPRGVTRSERGEAADKYYSTLRNLLLTENVPHLLSPREGGVVGIAQAPLAQLRRWLKDSGTGQLVGIGRDADTLGDVVDSYHDAQLALRALARGSADRDVMTYEDFDFATRLFSDVGLEKMSSWAGALLAPIQNQPILMDGLRRYFEHDLNTIAAAEALNVHHNSLRYRLAKIEELLGLSLRDPSAISSLYLALTAQAISAGSIAHQPTIRARQSSRGGTTGPGGPDNAVNSASRRPIRDTPGVALGPNR